MVKKLILSYNNNNDKHVGRKAAIERNGLLLALRFGLANDESRKGKRILS